MTKKILISTDTNGIATFKKSVQSTAAEANSLIELYHAFQPWQKISSVEDFITLATNPADYFDSTLLNNVEFKAKGVTPDPARLAELIGIHRSSFLNLCSGLNIPDEEGCKPCGKVRIRRGVRAISLSEFNRYSQYLNFDAGSGFTVNTEAVDADLDRFNTYAETPEQIALYEHFTALVELLNKHDAIYTMPNPVKKQTADALHLHLSQGMEGKFILNTAFITNEVLKIKYLQK